MLIDSTSVRLCSITIMIVINRSIVATILVDQYNRDQLTQNTGSSQTVWLIHSWLHLVQSPALNQVGLRSFCRCMPNRRWDSRSMGASASFPPTLWPEEGYASASLTRHCIIDRQLVMNKVIFLFTRWRWGHVHDRDQIVKRSSIDKITSRAQP